mmetsp:Transcript_45293/g.91376  ORF Transcript_45293/g.91376 Transcript_45293/m.91376 type:complete len:207 (-) Transcript_45293:593-1213(-)
MCFSPRCFPPLPLISSSNCLFFTSSLTAARFKKKGCLPSATFVRSPLRHSASAPSATAVRLCSPCTCFSRYAVCLRTSTLVSAEADSRPPLRRFSFLMACSTALSSVARFSSRNSIISACAFLEPPPPPPPSDASQNRGSTDFFFFTSTTSRCRPTAHFVDISMGASFLLRPFASSVSSGAAVFPQLPRALSPPFCHAVMTGLCRR